MKSYNSDMSRTVIENRKQAMQELGKAGSWDAPGLVDLLLSGNQEQSLAVHAGERMAEVSEPGVLEC